MAGPSVGQSSVLQATLPGCGQGYAALPDDVRQTIVDHVPLHSAFVRDAALSADFLYIDAVGDFAPALARAEALLLGDCADD